MAVLVNLHQVERKDVRLQGRLTAADLQLDESDELVHLREPLQYDLAAQKIDQSILVQGSLKARLECECARCLKTFQHQMELPDWTALLPLEGPEKVEAKDDFVDLTPLIREDILLAFPQHPLCDNDCAGLPSRVEVKARKSEGSAAWSELNKLKLK
jgi:uncharacterized protein